MDDCTFCRIERGALPADLIYQDDDVIAFKDIAPRAPFHVLVVPRKHIASLAETEDEPLLGHLVRVAAKLAKDAGFGERGFRVQANTVPRAVRTCSISTGTCMRADLCRLSRGFRKC